LKSLTTKKENKNCDTNSILLKLTGKALQQMYHRSCPKRRKN